MSKKFLIPVASALVTFAAVAEPNSTNDATKVNTDKDTSKVLMTPADTSKSGHIGHHSHSSHASHRSAISNPHYKTPTNDKSLDKKKE